MVIETVVGDFFEFILVIGGSQCHVGGSSGPFAKFEGSKKFPQHLRD